MPNLADLNHLDAYRDLFTDVTFWTPYVRDVCARHALAPCLTIRTGVPGTCPVFMVDERWVVKFYGRLFDGADAYAAEREAARLTAQDPAIRTARLAGEGELVPAAADWPWPYLIFEFIPGVSIGAVREQVSLADGLRAARELGDTVRRIHALPLQGSPVFPCSTQPYRAFLEDQRERCVENHRGWGQMPPHLIAQIERFLPPLDDLIDVTHPPHLIHADLTGDHLLGRLENGRWTSLAVIDFGDARTGDLLYELAALHLDLFGGDRRLLAAFLDAYGLPREQRADLPRRALATALLHQFNVFYALPDTVFQVDRLEALAGLFGVL